MLRERVVHVLPTVEGVGDIRLHILSFFLIFKFFIFYFIFSGCCCYLFPFLFTNLFFKDVS